MKRSIFNDAVSPHFEKGNAIMESIYSDAMSLIGLCGLDSYCIKKIVVLNKKLKNR